jgi:predicted nucleotidyltransferase
MTTQSEQKGGAQQPQKTAALTLSLPIRDGNLFKHSATADILHLLSQYPFSQYTHRELARRTNHNVNSIRSAVSVLNANDLVTVSQEGNAQPVSINRARLHRPDNPVLSVPQDKFQLPVQIAVEAIRRELTGVKGILLFGSVANGSADRQSDIDLWVLVETDRLQEQQQANQLSKRLSETVFPTDSALQAPDVAEITDLPSDTNPVEHLPDTEHGDRFEFEILVETPESIVNRADDRMTEILTEGLVLYRTETLPEVVDTVIEHVE